MSLNRADLHIHTNFSDGLHEPEDVIHYAVTHTQLRVLAITDHNTIDGALLAQQYLQNHSTAFSQIQLIVGEEISSTAGHILGLFLKEVVPPHLTPAETVDAIHRQGGIAIAAHPFTHLLFFSDLVGVGRQIAQVDFDGVEVRNSVPTELYANWMTAYYNSHYAHRTPVGGSDCHYLPMLGRTHTLFEGSTAAELKNAIQRKQALPGGSVNGPFTAAQLLRDHFRRRKLFNDHQYRLTAPSLVMNIEENHRAPIVIVHCTGQIVRDNAEVLKKQLTSIIEGGATWIVIDLSGVDFVDSAGLGAFIVTQKRARSLGGDLTLCSPSKGVSLTLKLVRLDLVLGAYASPEQAMAAFSKRKKK